MGTPIVVSHMQNKQGVRKVKSSFDWGHSPKRVNVVEPSSEVVANALHFASSGNRKAVNGGG